MIEKCATMAQCAQIAYMDGKEAKAEYKKLGYTQHKFIEKDGAQVHLIQNKNEIVLCFRGTEPGEFSDIKADLNAMPDKANNGSGLVHNGFQTEVDKVWVAIEAALAKAKPKDLFICGHSLGGAMATIATSRLADGPWNPVALYTYGSPRVGTRKFVKSFKNVTHYRHVNNNDLVTTVPFALIGYRHHCPPRYINYYGNIRKMSKWQRIKDKWRGRWRALKKGMPFDGAYDHGMNHYCKYTEQNNDR
jgi:triacylglycerol lipase